MKTFRIMLTEAHASELKHKWCLPKENRVSNKTTVRFEGNGPKLRTQPLELTALAMTPCVPPSGLQVERRGTRVVSSGHTPMPSRRKSVSYTLRHTTLWGNYTLLLSSHKCDIKLINRKHCRWPFFRKKHVYILEKVVCQKTPVNSSP